ncbi:sugar ABC transporter substrate-binding protein [Chelatococcus sp.]|uniref:ABC transporter substrate-binding protein n=1 Tax=Chelatococcus sp. TaxID=1953771 RepID=UPI0025BBF317|nr:sugar ABC transporter substrate-binding protein [Chelatococcus sp.]
MKMRKILSGSFATAVAGTMLFAATGAYAQSGKTVVTFAASHFAEVGRGDRLKAWVEKFNAANPDIEVKPVTIPFSSFASTIFTQLGGKGGPDLIRFDLPEFYAAAASNSVLPWDGVINDADYKFTSADSYLKINGKRYGVAFDTANYAMIYNAALLPDGKPPKTFDEFLTAAKAATKDGNYGFAYRATMAERGGVWYDVTNFVYGFGGRWSKPDGTPTFNSPEVVAGIAAYKQVYDAGITPKGTDAATYRRMFWEGKIATVVDNGGVATILTSQGKAHPISAAHSPFPHRQQGMILAPITINANTKVKDAAAKFLRWMLEPKNQQELQTLLGAVNVATIVERTPEELKEMPWLKAYDEQTPYSVPALPQGLEVKSPEIQQIVVQQLLKVLQGGVAPQVAMDEAQRLVQTRVLGQ